MSSVFTQGFSQLPANKLYINLININSTIVDSNNVPVPWLVYQPVAGPLSTAGAVVLRDMGKNVYLPDPTVTTGVGANSTILRRVQLVTTGTNGYYGTGNTSVAVAGSGTDFFTGYIRLGGQTYGGGTGIPTGVARLN
jgi:hypothetical protein